MEKQSKQLQCVKKTLLVMLNKTDIETSLDYYEGYYSKRQIVCKVLKNQQLPCAKKVMKEFIDKLQIVQRRQAHRMILNPCLTNGLGVYLLDQGVYHVVSGTGVKISQIVGEVFGQETLWGECFEYKLQVQTHECRYIFITKQLFLEFVMPEIIDILKQAYKVRQTARRKFESNNIQNLQSVRKNLRKPILTRHNNKYSDQRIKQLKQMLTTMEITPFVHKDKKKLFKINENNLNKIQPNKIINDEINTSNKQSKSMLLTPNKHNNHQLQSRSKTETMINHSKRYQSVNQFDDHSWKLKMEIQSSNKDKFMGYMNTTQDRTLSSGMKTLVQLQRYDEMKEKSRLQRGQSSCQIAPERSERIHSLRYMNSSAESNMRKIFTIKWKKNASVEQRNAWKNKLLINHIRSKENLGQHRRMHTWR